MKDTMIAKDVMNMTGFRAVEALSAVTGIDCMILHRVFNHLCVTRDDCTGMTISAKMVWEEYCREGETTERMFTIRLKRIANRLYLAKKFSIFLDENEGERKRTIEYLERVIRETRKPETREEAKRLLAFVEDLTF